MKVSGESKRKAKKTGKKYWQSARQFRKNCEKKYNKKKDCFQAKLLIKTINLK